MILPMILGLTLNQVSIQDIAENIRSLNPSISDKRATHLSKIINRESKRYDIDPNIITAILKQESNFKPAQKVCYIVHRQHACFVTCDFGVGQINQIWLNKWGLSEEEVVKNEDLNIHLTAKILSMIRHQFGEEEGFWSRYNTSGPRRAIYEASVQTYLAEIE